MIFVSREDGFETSYGFKFFLINSFQRNIMVSAQLRVKV